MALPNSVWSQWISLVWYALVLDDGQVSVHEDKSVTFDIRFELALRITKKGPDTAGVTAYDQTKGSKNKRYPYVVKLQKKVGHKAVAEFVVSYNDPLWNDIDMLYTRAHAGGSMFTDDEKDILVAGYKMLHL